MIQQPGDITRGRPRKARTGENAFSLTRAEREVLEGVAHGWSYVHIAEWLGNQPKTVRTLVLRVAGKLPRYGDLKGYALVLYHAAKWHQKEAA